LNSFVNWGLVIDVRALAGKVYISPDLTKIMSRRHPVKIYSPPNTRKHAITTSAPGWVTATVSDPFAINPGNSNNGGGNNSTTSNNTRGNGTSDPSIDRPESNQQEKRALGSD
jgi:hypothetical protein